MRLRVCAMALGLCASVSQAWATTLPAGFTETRIAGGLTAATAMTIAPDGRIFVLEQPGRVRIIKNGALLPTPFVTVTVNAALERGLLGIALDPAFTSNGFVYLYYTATSPNIHNRVARFTANGDVAVAGSQMVLLDLPNLSSAQNHNGGALHFGPDGRLYIAVGDNANAGLAPQLGSMMGKILRITATGSIPSDNPFFTQTTGNNRAIWARGFRNPFTFAFHRGTGRMFINDVGNIDWEEINDGVAGRNYGWGPSMDDGDATAFFRYQSGQTVVPGTEPTCAITGGAFYDPPTANFPSTYVGRYFFGDYCAHWIRTIDPATRAVQTFATNIGTFGSLVDIDVASDGSLYYLARADGAVFRIRSGATPTPTPRPTVVPTATPTPRPTIGPTPTPTPRPRPTVRPTATPTPRPTPTPGGAPAWQAWTAYATGALVTYDGLTYRCIQGHTSQPDWAPPNVPALWARQ